MDLYERPFLEIFSPAEERRFVYWLSAAAALIVGAGLAAFAMI